MKKKVLILVAILLPVALGAASRITVTGGARPVLTIQPERSSGLEGVYVVDSEEGAAPLTATYTPAVAGTSVTWSRFSTPGGGMAEPIEGASGYTLTGLMPDMGYIVTEGNRQYCFWVTDYASRPFELEALELGGGDCTSATLLPLGRGARMTYYSVNGRAIEIDREITVSYTTLAYDKESDSYVATEASQSFPYLHTELHVPAPLADTRFTISGDRFLRQWGLTAEAESPMLAATAVDATVSVGKTGSEGADNEIRPSGSDDALGGSAPAEISFNAAVTDAAIFTEWQFSDDPEFGDVTLSFPDTHLTHTFRESGVTYVRFIAANADGSCTYTGEPYAVSIGESELRCPNAFSPGASEGVNDEWRVSYRSIIDFECHIFDRSGRQITRFTDPAQGWDGRIGGRLASPGVYYYVIKATGSDGKRYNLSGDINIIGYR